MKSTAEHLPDDYAEKGASSQVRPHHPQRVLLRPLQFDASPSSRVEAAVLRAVLLAGLEHVGEGVGLGEFGLEVGVPVDELHVVRRIESVREAEVSEGGKRTSEGAERTAVFRRSRRGL